MIRGSRWSARLAGVVPVLGVVGGTLMCPAVGRAQEATAQFAPANIRSAYNFTSLPTTVNGSNQAIAILDFGNDTTISSDLATFDTAFGFPTANLVVENENGSTTPLEPNNITSDANELGSNEETALDVEFAHSIAPQAKIVLVELPRIENATSNDLTAAANTAASQASVVSLSIGFAAAAGEATLDGAFNHAGVTFVTATGDQGNFVYPATSPYSVAVGGTSLSLTGRTSPNTNASTGGTYNGEVVWKSDGDSSGGGVDADEAQPVYQRGASGVIGTQFRNVPDVAYDADPQTGEYSFSGGAEVVEGGTSIGAPQWAALFVLADQIRAADGLQPLSTANPTAFTGLVSPTGGDTNVLDMLYSLYDYDKPLYAELFHQITSGSNSAGDTANPNGGYSDVTGLGTPNAALLVDYLGGLTAVPEPSTAALCVAVAGLLSRRRRMGRPINAL